MLRIARRFAPSSCSGTATASCNYPRLFADETPLPVRDPGQIAALLKRERRSADRDPVDAKRIYRLMKKSGLLLARHTGRRVPRAHDGTIVTRRSNERWCSDAREFICWNGEIVRVAFGLNSRDREVISCVATTAGISGEMIRDMMARLYRERHDRITGAQA
ncbi:hypothetical protein IVB21_04970 [Bradyrhizobium sp. 18]|nr:hypothetical protein [Bradyrhizobium sp. 18]